MAKIKLPGTLSEWKVLSLVSDTDEGEIYSLVKKSDDSKKAKLAYYEFADELYIQEDIDFIKDEAEFVNSVRALGDITNYIDVCVDDNPDKKQLKLYIVTDDSAPLSEKLTNIEFNEDEVVDFGIQMSEILEKLEANNIYHGDIKPTNIYVTADGKYKLGGFMDAESFDDDASYLAPEIKNGEQADFTTDIYSLGLLMYGMSNNGKLPFENEGLSPEDAAEKRISGESVPPTANGSQKLKSVIHIACQPENKNRWKNAGNIKNALLSIKNESKEQAADVIIPESTDFEGNIFEQQAKKDSGDTKAIPVVAPVVASAVAAVSAAEAAAHTASEKSEDASPEKEADPSPKEADESSAETPEEKNEPVEEIKQSYKEPEIDNRVFDDYKNQTKIFTIDQPSGAKEKDYGSYFDDYDDVKPSARSVAIQDFDPFAAVNNEKDYDKDNKRSRKGLIIAIIVGICIILALLAALGLIACRNGFFGSNPFGASNDSAATATTATVAQGAADTTSATKSTQSTTAASTTVPSTTKSASSSPSSSSSSDTEKSEAAEYVTVKVVRGYTFEQAKEMLEADGLYISEGRHRPSDEYGEGLIIAQTPGDGHSVEKGSTVIVDISTGPEATEAPATEAPRQQSSSSSSSSSDDNVPFSECKYNTSYLSQNEVKSMSHSELNIAFNEIYARRGRIFTDSSLDSYFRSQSWYTPKYTASEFSQKVVFNDYETKNINLIYNEQHSRGYR